MLSAGVFERNVCLWVKNGGCSHNYHGHLGKQEVQKLLGGSAQSLETRELRETSCDKQNLKKIKNAGESIPEKKITDTEVGTSTSAYVTVAH